MIMAQWYKSVRPLKYKRVAAKMCRGYRSYYKSMCITFAIRLIKYCDSNTLSNTIECFAIVEQKLREYMQRVTGAAP